MNLSRIATFAPLGMDGARVDVESQVIPGKARISIVGLPDGVLKEARDRVRCAIENSGFGFPKADVVVNLSPAALPKTGSGFDLAIALSILAAAGLISAEPFAGGVVIGELGLDGTLRAIPGALAAATYTRERRCRLFLPLRSARAAVAVPEVSVLPFRSLYEAVRFARAPGEFSPAEIPAAERAGQSRSDDTHAPVDFGDVIGQHGAKRALEICAAGGHNLLMVGPPGSGKSMLASRVRSILPALTLEESIEVTKLHCARLATEGGRHSPEHLILERPFRAPHHTTSTAGLIGGGAIPQPGEISLSHRGVLFLDELPEFRREALESLRQPIENRSVLVSRSVLRIRYPADFILIAAMNPCPCGRRGLPDQQCRCSQQAIDRYLSRLSGPLLDRIDLQLWVGPVPFSDLTKRADENPTEGMAQRVLGARNIQRRRTQSGMRLNASMGSAEVRACCPLDVESSALLESASKRFHLSARGFTRVLRVARTIADLERSDLVCSQHVAEALSHRVQVQSRGA